MDFFDVIPKYISITSISFIVNALLSKVFKNNILSPNLCFLAVLNSAVLSITESLFLLDSVFAVVAFPSDKMWSHENKFSKFVIVLLEVTDEI